MNLRTAIAMTALAGATTLAPFARAVEAQSPAERIEAADRERSSNPAAALRQYEAVLGAEGGGTHYEALWKASMAAVDAGETTADDGRRAALYKTGEQYARRATQANPNDAEGHFALARALGRTAQSLGKREKVKYAGEVRAHALEALRLDPRHAGALHVIGSWHAEVMRLNGMERFMAKNFLGGQVFSSANWNEAQRSLEQAVAIEPNRLVHRIDLAEIYADRGNSAKAREHAEFIVQAPATELADPKYKRDAEALLRRLR